MPVAFEKPRSSERLEGFGLAFGVLCALAVFFVGCVSCTALLSAADAQEPAETVTGPVKVIDGDTLDIARQAGREVVRIRVRLHGIDAPENVQQCENADGWNWPCGQAAAEALRELIGLGAADADRWDVTTNLGMMPDLPEVTCEGTGRDRYGRLVAVCHARDIDLNRFLVAEGLALAYREYSTDYVEAEDAARKAGRGLWAGRFIEPWKWRRGERLGD